MSQENIKETNNNGSINAEVDNSNVALGNSENFQEILDTDTIDSEFQPTNVTGFQKAAFQSLTGNFFKTNERGRVVNRFSIIMEAAFALFVSSNGSEGPISIMKGAGYKHIHPAVKIVTDVMGYVLGGANLYSDTQSIDINEEADESVHEKPKKQADKKFQFARDIYTTANQAVALPHFVTGALADALGTATLVEKITGNYYGQLAANAAFSLFFGPFGTNYYYMAFKAKFGQHTDAIFDTLLNPGAFLKVVGNNKLKAMRVIDQALNNAVYRGVSFAFILKAWLALMTLDRYEDVSQQLVWDMFALSIWVVLHHRTLNVVNSLFGEFKILEHKDFENLETSSFQGFLETTLEGIRAVAIGYLSSVLIPIPYAFPRYAVPTTIAMLAFGAGYKVTSQVRLQQAALNRLKEDSPAEYKSRLNLLKGVSDAGNESGYESSTSLNTLGSNAGKKITWGEHSERFKDLASERYLTLKLRTVNFLLVLGGRLIRSASYYQMVEVVTPDLGMHLYFMGKVCFAFTTGLPVSYNEATLFGPMVDANTPRVSLKHDLLWFRDAKKYVQEENRKVTIVATDDEVNILDEDTAAVQPLVQTAKLKNYRAGFFKETSYWVQAYWTKGSANFAPQEIDDLEEFLNESVSAQKSMV